MVRASRWILYRSPQATSASCETSVTISSRARVRCAKNPAGQVQVLELVHAPTLPRNAGDRPSAAQMWSIRFFEPAHGTVQGVSGHADPNTLHIPALVADAIERRYMG
jgi:hypothetical protein